MDLTFLSATGFTAVGIVIGALAEERLWWLLHRAYPRRQRPGEVARPVPAVHAGQYTDPGRVRAGVCGLDYPQFRRPETGNGPGAATPGPPHRFSARAPA